MPELRTSAKRPWLFLLIFVLGVSVGVGVGYALFNERSSANEAKAAAAPPAVVSQPTPPESTPASVESQPPTREANPVRDTLPDEPRARMPGRLQAFMDQLTPEQRAKAEELRAQVRQNASEWRNLTPEERRQRIADLATNNLGMSPDAFQRLQSRLNLTPEQQERWQQRLQAMRDRNRNRAPR